ncbi:MAG: polynucleotide adenylyltransferase PcnB, partial [Limnohabitans sp.]
WWQEFSLADDASREILLQQARPAPQRRKRRGEESDVTGSAEPEASEAVASSDVASDDEGAPRRSGPRRRRSRRGRGSGSGSGSGTAEG